VWGKLMSTEAVVFPYIVSPQARQLFCRTPAPQNLSSPDTSNPREIGLAQAFYHDSANSRESFTAGWNPPRTYQG
jgi:hypothetical protein